jgi:hypothetical protein
MFALLVQAFLRTILAEAEDRAFRAQQASGRERVYRWYEIFVPEVHALWLTACAGGLPKVQRPR